MRKTVMTEKLRQQIWNLDSTERACILATTILQQSQGPVAPIMGLIELVARMASHLNQEKRFYISERLRSAADRCELAPTFDAVRS